MIASTLCLLAVAVAWQRAEAAPAAFLILLGAGLWLAARHRRAAVWLLPVLLLLVMRLAWQDWRIGQTGLPEPLHGRVLVFDVRIEATPRATALGQRMRVSLHDPTLPRQLLLQHELGAAWAPLAGQCWRVRARLSPLRGLRNPGTPNYARLQRERGVGARARVLQVRHAVPCVDATGAWRWRIIRRVRAGLHAAGGETPARAILDALVTGERYAIDDVTQQVLQRTGTSHLMAISGLHVGLVAGLGALLVRALPVPVARVRRDVAAIAGLLCAGLYSALSGFALPTQRALLMITAVVVLLALRLPVTGLRLLALAAACVTLAAPAVVVTPSFVFSFAAVALLALQHATLRHRQRSAPRSQPLLHAQWLLSLALLPVAAAFFGVVSLVSVVANLVAVPVFSLAVVPLALLGGTLSAAAWPPAHGVWQVALYIVERILRWLDWIASAPVAAVAVPALPVGVSAALVCATAAALLLPQLAARALLLPTFAAIWLLRSGSPPYGCVEVTQLDVGHGTAIVLQLRGRDLLYDTGPRWRSGTDAGARVLIPFLRAAGIRTLDLAIVSHADADHDGGADTLERSDRVRRWRGAYAFAGGTCQAGQRWQVDGVSIEALWPLPGHPLAAARNDGSCVLRVVAARQVVLLTGDIEAAAERELVALGRLRADLVSLPHHGSATSSTAAFVAAVRARDAWASAAASGRWRLPDTAVVARWRALGSRVQGSAEAGALRQRLCGTRATRRLREG